MSERKQIKRGAVNRANSEFVGFWLPKPIVDILDVAVIRFDTDRSKLLRRAIEEKLTRELDSNPSN